MSRRTPTCIALCAATLAASLVLTGSGAAQRTVACSSPAGPAACAGTSRAPFVTPAQTRAAFLALWKAHERALDTRNQKLMRELDTGSELLIDTYAARDVAICGCPFYWTQGPRPVRYLSIYYPRQTHYPLYFLAQTNTQESATTEANVLQIVTKASPTDPWRLAVLLGDWGYARSRNALPPPVPDLSSRPYAGYLEQVYKPTAAQAAAWPGELVRYWMSLKKHGKPPAKTSILPGPMSTGTDLSVRREGAGPDGLTRHFRFAVVGGPWTFRIGGMTWACTDIHEGATSRPTNPGLYLVQQISRANYGPDLAPGGYSTITQVYDWPLCLFRSSHPNGAPGVDTFGWVDTGTPIGAHGTRVR